MNYAHRDLFSTILDALIVKQEVYADNGELKLIPVKYLAVPDEVRTLLVSKLVELASLPLEEIEKPLNFKSELD